MTELLHGAFAVSLLSGTIRIATPLLYASLGELITERSGVLNLGIEGTMLVGALVGFLTTYNTGSLWAGVVTAVAAGAMMSLIMALMAVTLKADQVVSGLALNLFASGITFFVYRLVFKRAASANLPNILIFKVVPIPILSKMPFIGEVFFSQYALTYIAFILVAPAVFYYLYRTKYGLTLRCIGENPEAVDMKGVRIARYQYLALVFGGMMSGAGGAFLTLASAGLFVPDMTGGRGWIAFALVIFGDWKPFRILIGTLFFGFLETFQQQMQGLGVQFPHQFLLALPYLFTIIATIIGRRRSGAPIALGIPYRRD